MKTRRGLLETIRKVATGASVAAMNPGTQTQEPQETETSGENEKAEQPKYTS